MTRFLKSRGISTLLFVLLAPLSIVPSLGAASQRPVPRLEKHTPEAFDQILRENALFFSMLVSFSFTAAIAEPVWGLNVKNINLNLITRAVRDPRGRQFVRLRVAGVVRKNNNVELNVLDENGVLVGKGFFGYRSGQITFYDQNSKAIINGFMDSRGEFLLDDLRLPEGKRDLANGYVDPCFSCRFLSYGWWDGLNVQVGGGRMFPFFVAGGSDLDRIRMYWTFDRGRLSESQSAGGEAEYDLRTETTGAINSVLFDTKRTAESFFANPYSLVPDPLGKSLIPRFTNHTGIAVTNSSSREAPITYIARRADGALVAGDGITNPISYIFGAGQQFTAFPAEIFRGLSDKDQRPILKDNEVGWIEIFSDDADVQAMYLDGDAEGTALDGNVGEGTGSNVLIFPDVRLGPLETTEIALLNLAYDDVVVRLELLDREGRVLREEREFFISGYGMRNFYLSQSSNFLQINDPAQGASLRVTCNNENSLKSSSCSKVIGVATFNDRYNSLASAYAASSASAGAVLLAPHILAGRSGNGNWETVVKVVRLGGDRSPVYLDLYDGTGNRLYTVQESLAPGGQAMFVLNGSTLPWGDRLTTGYVRLSSDSGNIAGDASVTWSDGRGSMSSTYTLVNSLSRVLQFNQVAQGVAGGIEYWTGISLVNDLDKQVSVTVKVIRSDGKIDRSTDVRLQPYQQLTKLLPQLFQDPAYSRLSGYIQVTASDPVSAVVLYGNSDNRFLSAVPGIAR